MIISRHISKSLINPLIIVLTVCVSIVWLTQSLRFIDLIVSKGIDFLMVLSFTITLLPSFINIILPVATIITIVFFYNKLMCDNEITAMKAVGLSGFQIIKPALIFSAGITIVSYFTAFYLAPVSHQVFQKKKAFLQNHYAAMVLQEGVFTEPIKGLVIYIDQVKDNQQFQGILVSDNRDKNKEVVIMAQKANVVNKNGTTVFELIKGNRQEKKHGKITMVYFDNFPINISNTNKSEKDKASDVEDKTIFDFIEDIKNNNLTKKSFAEFHNKLSWPLLNVLLGVLAAIILINSKYNRFSYFTSMIKVALLSALFIGIAVFSITLTVKNSANVIIIYFNLLTILIFILFNLYQSQNSLNN